MEKIYPSFGIKSKFDDLGRSREELQGMDQAIPDLCREICQKTVKLPRANLQDKKKLKGKILAMLLPFYGIIA